MCVDPALPDAVHSMRATGIRGLRTVALRTLDEHAFVALQLQALHVVVEMRGREFRVRRTVARFAFDSTMTARETIER
jgi:hypothetical protein